MATTHRLTLAAELEARPAFRDFVGRACVQAGLDASLIDDLKLAIDEACANIIMHGYAGLPRGDITVELSLDAARAMLRIIDTGHAFDPHQAATPDVNAALKERSPGGFGEHFIFTVMDVVDYQSGAGGNQLTLTKNL